MIIKRPHELPINGCLVEVMLAIEGDYQPHRKATLTDPEVDAEFKISGIYLGGADISGVFGKPDLRELEESILVEIIERGSE
jgi:hypothetical protein